MSSGSPRKFGFLALRITSRLAGRLASPLGEGERCEIRLLGDQLSIDQLEWNQSAREAEEFLSRGAMHLPDQLQKRTRESPPL
jgi:hypothetical protein